VLPASTVGIAIGSDKYADLDYADNVVLLAHNTGDLGIADGILLQATWVYTSHGRRPKYRTSAQTT